jgi:hypothetical protein
MNWSSIVGKDRPTPTRTSMSTTFKPSDQNTTFQYLHKLSGVLAGLSPESSDNKIQVQIVAFLVADNNLQVWRFWCNCSLSAIPLNLRYFSWIQINSYHPGEHFHLHHDAFYTGMNESVRRTSHLLLGSQIYITKCSYPSRFLRNRS